MYITPVLSGQQEETRVQGNCFFASLVVVLFVCLFSISHMGWNRRVKRKNF